MYFLFIMFHKKFLYDDLSSLTSDTLFKNGQIINFKCQNVKEELKMFGFKIDGLNS